MHFKRSSSNPYKYIYIEEKSIDREEVHLQIQNVSHIYFSERDEFKEFIRRGVLSIQQYVLVVVVLDLQQCQVQWLCLEEEKVVYGCVISRNISNQDLSLSNNHIYIHNGYELTPIPYRKSDAFHTYIYSRERLGRLHPLDLQDFIEYIHQRLFNTLNSLKKLFINSRFHPSLLDTFHELFQRLLSMKYFRDFTLENIHLPTYMSTYIRYF